MYRLFEFFYQYRSFLFFVLLEIVSIWLIVQNNNYQGAAFFNSSNRYAGSILETRNDVQDYFNLKQENAILAAENARLKQQLVIHQQIKESGIGTLPDSLRAYRYQFTPAKVVNNSTAFYNNFLTINKGTADGIHKGMGIISPEGVVGRIKECSDHYCTAISLLNTKIGISGKVKGKGIECHIKWEGKNPHEAAMTDVTRNQKIQVGDTILTSGYNPFFPEGIMIGVIKNLKEEGGSYWKASVNLATDFTSLDVIYIIGNKLEAEQDSLEKTTTEIHP